VSKPISKKEAILREKFANPELDHHSKNPEKELRLLKKVYKKSRTKYLRKLGKKELKEECEEFIKNFKFI
jgi:hypothetical protein